MKTKYLIGAGLMCLSSAALCTNAITPERKMLEAALETYLAQHGNFCLGKFDWPVEVSESEFKMRTRNAIQLPVLQKAGLVAASKAVAMRKQDGIEQSVPVIRYALTDAGKKYYIRKEIPESTPDGNKLVKRKDLCAAKLSPDKIVRWNKPRMVAGHEETTLSYTYKITAPPWSQNLQVQQVFPMLARIMQGAGTLQLQQRFRLVGDAWVAVIP